jgi:hypothetical protein
MSDTVGIPAMFDQGDGPWETRNVLLRVFVYVHPDDTTEPDVPKTVVLDMWDDPDDNAPDSIILTPDTARQLADELIRQADRLDTALAATTTEGK